MNTKIYTQIALFILMLGSLLSCDTSQLFHPQEREVISLNGPWKFVNHEIDLLDSQSRAIEWKTVTVPHDWAISGPFDVDNDPYNVKILEDGDSLKTKRTGLTGGLPHVGIGWYRKTIPIKPSDKNRKIFIELDGVMSNATIYVNGSMVGEWPYGYSSFGFDITEYLDFEGENEVQVRAENLPRSSRWYPGAGIYRDVRLIKTSKVYIKQWGTYITTPKVSDQESEVKIETTILNEIEEPGEYRLVTQIFSPSGKKVGESVSGFVDAGEINISHIIQIENPELWTPEDPQMYKAVSWIFGGGKNLDRFDSSFGIRSLKFTADDGFFLNGKRIQLKGVCLHHDLGPLGAADNEASLRHRLNLLKGMGANAIRCSHNPPSPRLLKLTDEMGFLVIDEAFDEWKEGKVANGYHRLWDEWAEKDLVAMIQRDRNHPSIIMWSLGNEIREQSSEGGAEVAKFLVDIAHREDKSRPTTAGFNQLKPALKNGLAEIVDVAGWNYKPKQYANTKKDYPDLIMYGSETASTIGSRGIYKLPAVEKQKFDKLPPYQLSSYALLHPYWGTIPDTEFMEQDRNPFILGEFVWTGFDYLGEPTPFYTQWPSRSSYFGIFDLTGIPKDRYFLYKSKWSDEKVLHLLPHWNWQSGQKVPVHCFTNYDRAELFLNGRSLGIREKDSSQLLTAYRLIWEDVPFEEGELKVVAIDEENKPLEEAVRQTAGEPFAIKLEANRTALKADGKDLSFITVSIIDEKGIVCPNAENLVEFTIEGKGSIKAVGNGDPTSLESFVEPQRKAFSGKCMVIIQPTTQAGEIKIMAESEGLQKSYITLKSN